MNALLEPLWASPRLPELLHEANHLFALEQVRRAEFVANLRPDLKAEWINGEPVMHSPARGIHISAVGNLGLILNSWLPIDDIGLVCLERAYVRLGRHDFEPDLCYFSAEQVREHRLHGEQMIFPVPTFVVEVLSPSTEANDRGVKLQTYGAFGVGEYWIVDPDSRTVEQYLQQGGERLARHATLGAEATLASPTFPGLELPVAALFDTAAARALVRRFAARSA